MKQGLLKKEHSDENDEDNEDVSANTSIRGSVNRLINDVSLEQTGTVAQRINGVNGSSLHSGISITQDIYTPQYDYVSQQLNNSSRWQDRREIERPIYGNERAEVIDFSSRSTFFTDSLTGLNDIRNEIYFFSSMGQDGKSYINKWVEMAQQKELWAKLKSCLL